MKLIGWKLIVLGLALIPTSVGANTQIMLSDQADPGARLAIVEVTDPEPSHLVLDFDLAGYTMSPVDIDGVTYQKISIDREGISFLTGKPDLPHIARSVIIPDNAAMEARVVSSNYHEFDNINITPSKGEILRTTDPSSVPYQFDDIYQEDRWYPEEIVSQGDPYILRDFRGMVVSVNPVQYNPVQGKIRVYDTVVVEVIKTGPGQINVFDRQGDAYTISADFAQLYQDRFLNPPEERYQMVQELGEMLIIAEDSFISAMMPLVEWKNQAGVKTEIVAKSTAGATPEAIKSYVQNVYNTSDLAYLLLVGDVSQIPTFYSYGGGADPLYALLAGSDNYPDILIGRFSAENIDHVNTQVERTINYERDVVAGALWVQQGMGVASTEGPGHYGEYDNVHMGYIRNDLIGYGYSSVDEFYGYGATTTGITNAFNEGRGIANYIGHGSETRWVTSGFSNTHVNALQNMGKLPFIHSVACVNGNFTATTCFAEAWLRATHQGSPTGAIGTYMATINQSWQPPMYAQDETIDLLTSDAFRTMGGLWFNGSCYMIDLLGSSGIKHYNTWIIFGDPSLRIRTKAATELAVEHEGMVEADATTFAVTVPGEPGALCGVSNNGEYIGSAFTNAEGVAEVSLSTLPSEGSVTLTVTAYNHVPYITEITIGAPAIPNLLAAPESFLIELDLGDSTSELLSITNNGEEGSVLEFSLHADPAMLNSWIQVGTTRGQVLHNETTQISIMISAAGLSTGIHQGSLSIMSNGGDAVIPVTLIAGNMAGTDDREAALSLQLSPASPNPFTSQTAISFVLPTSSSVLLGVYDMSGRLVRSLVSDNLAAGAHNLNWDGRDDNATDLPGGVYFYKLTTSGKQLSRKVMVLR